MIATIQSSFRFGKASQPICLSCYCPIHVFLHMLCSLTIKQTPTMFVCKDVKLQNLVVLSRESWVLQMVCMMGIGSNAMQEIFLPTYDTKKFVLHCICTYFMSGGCIREASGCPYKYQTMSQRLLIQSSRCLMKFLRLYKLASIGHQLVSMSILQLWASKMYQTSHSNSIDIMWYHNNYKF